MIGRQVSSSLEDRRPVLHETGIMYERTVDFLREVRTELSKVSWPSRNELIGSTTVVIIITLILAAFTGVIDFILSIILSRLLGA